MSCVTSFLLTAMKSGCPSSLRTSRFDTLTSMTDPSFRLRVVSNVEVDGRVVGQVNGLSVVALPEISIGWPARLSAQVRVGDGEVVDIEREVHFGGPIHSKGVLILSGFLGGTFGRQRPLSLHASLVFEQSYGGIEGDSASLAELCAAKHAQVGLMRTVAKEAAARRIRVNTLHPGPIDNAFQARIEENIGKMAGIDATRMLNEAIPLHRHGAPDEIARSALYLASDLSSFVTGSMLMADGGLRG